MDLSFTTSTFLLLLAPMVVISAGACNTGSNTDLIITGVIDGPLAGGTPKAIEFYATNNIIYLSIYCLTSPNNGGTTPTSCSEFTFSSVPLSAGSYIYVSYESTGFSSFFGFDADYAGRGVANINGDDAVVLFKNDVVVDRFGAEATDGTGTAWEYADSWAYRKNDSGANPTFTISEWTLPGINVLDGTSTNAASSTPSPLRTYQCTGGGGSGNGSGWASPTAPTKAPTPAPVAAIPAPGPVIYISTVQGSTATSPYVGQTVTVEAVVVGDFQNGDADTKRELGGFYVQEEDSDIDGNDMTSEGLFIVDPSPIVDVNLGDVVQVTGVIGESYGQTQLVASSVVVKSTNAPLPTAAVISFPVANSILVVNSYEPDLEQFEGMLVTVSSTMHIIEMYNLDRYNEIKLYNGERPSQYAQVNTPSSSGYSDHIRTLGKNRITYDDGLSSQNQAVELLDGFGPTYDTATAPRMGDTITGLTGVMTYGFSAWRIRCTVDGSNNFVKANPRPLAPPLVGNGNVKMTSFNVLNFFATIDESGATAGPSGLDPRGADSIEEYNRQLQKLVTAITTLDADILGLIELENDFGIDETSSDDSALHRLVNAVNTALGSTVYAAVYPGQRYVDASDAISVGIMYKTSIVTLVGSPAILRDNDLPSGSTPPIFDGPSTNRSPLAVTFTSNNSGGECITIACNHFKSKGGSGTTGTDANKSDGAGNYNGIRTKAAIAVADWLQTEPTGYACSNKAIIGDLNAYAKEDPIQYLTTTAGYTNVETDTDYSYVYDGQIGTLDYILLYSELNNKKTGSGVWHICEDEADALDYNLDHGRNPNYFDGNSVARPSDHSPVLVGLDLTGTLVLRHNRKKQLLRGRRRRQL